jgi:hypothetical protein
MDLPEFLSMRFHFLGEFKQDGKEWLYKEGSTGMSKKNMSKLLLPEQKRHLAQSGFRAPEH